LKHFASTPGKARVVHARLPKQGKARERDGASFGEKAKTHKLTRPTDSLISPGMQPRDLVKLTRFAVLLV